MNHRADKTAQGIGATVRGFAGLATLLACAGLAAWSHDVITTRITWDREISRIVYSRCASCHAAGGTSFPLLTYQQAQPWAKAIAEETLERRMPPWGAVKGFGEFRNDQALTQEQLELIANWVAGGAPEGEANDLPPLPRVSSVPPAAHRPGEMVISGDYTLEHAFKLDGMWPQIVPDGASLQIVAELPGGAIKPLLWLRDYKTRFGHEFLLRRPLDLPAGSVIRGVPPGASLVLLPAPGRS